MRDKEINKELIDSNCPRCSEDETWEYIVQCLQTRQFRVDFLVELQSKLEAEVKMEIEL